MSVREPAHAYANGPERVRHELERLLGSRRTLRVIDAGCGSQLHVDVGQDAHVVGIDVSAEALERNKSINERIVADVQTYTFPAASFDVAICWDVLEHLPEPLLALERIVHALKDDGLLVLALPNVLSLKGLVTKLTPHRFHAWAYRRILRSEAEPFRTYLRLSMSAGSLERFARRENLEILYRDAYEGAPERELLARSRVLAAGWRGSAALLKALALGRIDPTLSELVFVMRKRAGAERRDQRAAERVRARRRSFRSRDGAARCAF